MDFTAYQIGVLQRHLNKRIDGAVHIIEVDMKEFSSYSDIVIRFPHEFTGDSRRPEVYLQFPCQEKATFFRGCRLQMVIQDGKSPDPPGHAVFSMSLSSMRGDELVDNFPRISAFYPGSDGLTMLSPRCETRTARALGNRMRPAVFSPWSWPPWLVDENCLVDWTTSPSDLVFRLKAALRNWFRLHGELDGFYNEQTFAKQVVALSVSGLAANCGKGV